MTSCHGDIIIIAKSCQILKKNCKSQQNTDKSGQNFKMFAMLPKIAKTNQSGQKIASNCQKLGKVVKRWYNLEEKSRQKCHEVKRINNPYKSYQINQKSQIKYIANIKTNVQMESVHKYNFISKPKIISLTYTMEN